MPRLFGFASCIVWMGALIALIAFGNVAMAIEQPSYAVSAKSGAIEVRDYAPQLAAQVEVTGEREAAINAGFRLLADYIFGNNQENSKVAMTAPVIQAPKAEAKGQGGRSIAMTAPVVQAPAGENGWSVRFIMPAKYTLESIPRPNNPRVRLLPVASQRVAAIRFSGLANEKVLQRKTEELRAYLAAQKLVAAGPAMYAFYDPPWTLPFLRRNEVLIDLAG
jgi:hypothetical protein